MGVDREQTQPPNGLTLYVDSEGVVRDPEGFVIGPDIWIDGKPYEGTPLRESDDG